MLISQRWERVHRLVMTTRDESNYKSYYKSVYLNSQKKKKKNEGNNNIVLPSNNDNTEK